MTTMASYSKKTSSKRRRGTLGESFTEVLVSILISSLGVAILAAAVAAALNISQSSVAGEDGRAACVSAAEGQLAASSSFTNNAGTISVIFGDSSLDAITFGSTSSALSSVKAYTTNGDTTIQVEGQTVSDTDPGFESLLVFKNE